MLWVRIDSTSIVSLQSLSEDMIEIDSMVDLEELICNLLTETPERQIEKTFYLYDCEGTSLEDNDDIMGLMV